MAGTLTNSIRLVAVATAVACARQFTAQLLKLWNVPVSIADDACLITSELVTNAVCATGTLEPQPSPETLAGLPLIGLKLTIARGRLFIEVADTSDAPPQMQQQYEAAERGRGLFLVAMLAEQWSYYTVETGGKVVWAELALLGNGEQNDDMAAEAADLAVRQIEPLPKRIPGASLSAAVVVHAEAMADVAMLERVLWGLQGLKPARCLREG